MSTRTPRMPHLGLALAAVLLALVPWTEAGGATLPGLWFDAALHLVAWSLIVSELLRRREVGLPRALMFWLPAAAAAAFSATRASYGYAAWLVTFEWLSALGLVAGIVLVVARSVAPGDAPDAGVTRRRLAHVWVLCAVPAALLAIVQVLAGQRGGGAFVNPNHLGAWLAASLPLAVAVLPARGLTSKYQRGWICLVAVALLGGVLASGSRSALVALAVIGPAAAVVQRRHLAPRSRRVVAAVAMGFVLLASLALGLRFADGTDIYRYDRLRIWPRSAEMLIDAPLWGIGPGQFAHRASVHTFAREDGSVRYGRTFRTPHSHALLWLVECGVIGSLLLVGGLLAAVLAARRDWASTRVASAERRVAVAAVSGLCVFAVVSLFDEPLARPSLLLAAAVLAGLALPSPPRRQQVSWRPSWGRATFIITVVAVVVPAGVLMPAVSSHLASRAQLAADPARRVAGLERAAAVNPWQGHYAGEVAALMLTHAASPLDTMSYSRIYRAVDVAVNTVPDEASFRVTRARLERRACVELFRDALTCDRADADYLAAIRAAPKDARILREAASHAALLQRHEVAVARLRQALDLEPLYVAAWRDLAALLQASGEPRAQREATGALARARAEALTRTADSPYATAILDVGAVPGPDDGFAGEGG